MPPRRSSPDLTDHDLLVTIDAKLGFLQTSLGETRSALSARIDLLGKEKANLSDLDPLRKAIERQQADAAAQCDDIATKVDKDDFKGLKEDLKSVRETGDGTRRLVWIGVGILATLQLLVPYILLHK